ncbi:MAG: WD40/YVTN/BNR-like repeat-containing protein [Gaiellaceae bacterium]
MIALAETAGGVYTVDLATEEIESFAPGAALDPHPQPQTGHPPGVAPAARGSTVVVAVDAKPPLLVSHDAGRTWRESGRGLPKGQAVAVAAHDPDLLLYAAGPRLFVSRDGGRFWTALACELPEEAVSLAWLE